MRHVHCRLRGRGWLPGSAGRCRRSCEVVGHLGQGALSSAAVPLGAIAVFGRTGGGHVGQVVGVYANGDLDILVANQGNAIDIRRFPRYRLIAFRWPADHPIGPAAPLVRVVSAATSGEA